MSTGHAILLSVSPQTKDDGSRDFLCLFNLAWVQVDLYCLVPTPFQIRVRTPHCTLLRCKRAINLHTSHIPALFVICKGPLLLVKQLVIVSQLNHEQNQQDPCIGRVL